jgi:hypothetical protein
MGDYDIDERGYPREKDGKLIHRKVAYRDYKANKGKYSQPFSKYQVHHKDGNKKNFRGSNLEIVTEGEHREIHGIPYQPSDRSVAIGGLTAFFSVIITFLICRVLIHLKILEIGVNGGQVFGVGLIIFIITWFLLMRYMEEDKILSLGLAFIGSGIIFTILAGVTNRFSDPFIISLLFFVGCLFKIYHLGFKSNGSFFKWVFSNILYYAIPIVWFGYVYLPKYNMLRELPSELIVFLVGSILLGLILSYFVLIIPFYIYWRIFKRK